MLAQTIQSLSEMLQPNIIFIYLIPSVVLGLTLGFLPGLAGVTGMIMLLPYVPKMPLLGCMVCMLSLASVSVTGGTITSIIFGIPGTGANAATILDGHPLAEQGQAARALGAALFASPMGGVFGALILYLLIPVVKPIVLLLGPPEFFFLIVLGIACIALIGSSGAGGMLKGVTAGGLGLLISLVGGDVVTGQQRFTLGTSYLQDGLTIHVMALGLFAIAEIISMLKANKAIAKTEVRKISLAEVFQGGKEVFTKWKTFLVGSIAGVIVGIIPGIGANVGSWVAYAMGKKFSKNPETFGSGNIEGVIAPEAANNATEGGSLLPTVAFGIPGSVSAAIVLATLMMRGVPTGPRLFLSNPGLIYSMIWIVIISNIICAIICIFFAPHLARLTFLRPSTLVPILLSLVAIGAIGGRGQILDLFMVIIIGVFGYLMRTFGYSRPALLVGFMLGKEAERNLQLSLQSIGPYFYLRPICIVLVVLILFLIIWSVRKTPEKAL